MMATIVEDSTLLFLCIFGSQLASVIIAIFGGVSTIVLGSSSRLPQPMTLMHTSTGINPTFPVAVGCKPNFKYNHLTILHFHCV